MITCLNISNDGSELLVGCQSGAIYLLDSFSLRVQHKLTPSDHACVDVIFSAGSNYVASGDASHAVTMWERQDPESNDWSDMGRFRPHSDDLIQLMASGSRAEETMAISVEPFDTMAPFIAFILANVRRFYYRSTDYLD